MSHEEGTSQEKDFQKITGLTSGETKAECYNICAEHCWTLRP